MLALLKSAQFSKKQMTISYRKKLAGCCAIITLSLGMKQAIQLLGTAIFGAPKNAAGSSRWTSGRFKEAGKSSVVDGNGARGSSISLSKVASCAYDHFNGKLPRNATQAKPAPHGPRVAPCGVRLKCMKK